MELQELKNYGTVTQSNKDFVAEEITEKVLSKWFADTPARLSAKLIFAQTGRGKNYFIEDVLLSFAYHKNKSVLIVSNRQALDMQIKNRLATKFNDILEYCPEIHLWNSTSSA